MLIFSLVCLLFYTNESVLALEEIHGTHEVVNSEKVVKVEGEEITSKESLKDNSTTIGSDIELAEKPKQEEQLPISTEPSIKNVTVSGDFDEEAVGVDFFKKIKINLIGENLTDDHFLTKEGLHWSNKTTVDLIKGVENGFINSEGSFGTQNNPTIPVKSYSMNVGDSGRINYVGKTKSGIDLDLIWTVTGSDSADWKANSGYYDSNRPTGLAFTGEQNIPDARGNSIVVLYNEANTLGLHYKIVKHGTLDEQSVIISFISTDIDAAQGVQTDLANLVELIPAGSGLKKSVDGVIYDGVHDMMALNGSRDLPKGGYLGAGFLSSFNYTFYSPAPPRFLDTYDYALGVRYDIFGSSLQADLITRIAQHIRVRYVDSSGKELKKEEIYSGFTDKSYKFDFINIPEYRLVDIGKNEEDKNHPIITFIYHPEHKVTLHFVDENGTKLQDSKTITVLEGQTVSYTPAGIDGFTTPDKLKKIITKDTEYQLVYKKQLLKKSRIPKDDRASSSKTISTISGINSLIDTGYNVGSTTYFQSPSVPHVQSEPQKTTNQAIKSFQSPKKANNPATKDPFLVNTNMTKEDKKAFLNYIHNVAKEARIRYGNDKNKINHEVANAIAYSTYHDDLLQKSTNDFGEKPKGLTNDIKRLLKEIYRNDKYTIDFPHLAMPLATSEKSVWYKEVGKYVAGLSPLSILGITPKDTFFQANSLLGDQLTVIDNKDLITDIDAYILKYHPAFKDLPLDERIEKYYSIDNLDQKRAEYYQEILEQQSEGSGFDTFSKVLTIGSLSTLASVGLLGLFEKRNIGNIKNGIEKLFHNPIEFFNDTIRPAVTNIFNEFKKDPLAYIGNKISSPLGNLMADTIVSAKAIVTFAANKINNKIIRPIINRVKPVYNAIIRPAVTFIKKKVVKPFYNGVVEPAINGVNTHIVKPVYNNVIKPVGNWVQKKVINPIYQKVIKPSVNWINNTVVRPVINRVIKPVYNKVIKPFVQPIYKKVVKPAVNWVKKQYNKAKNWFKKLF